MDNTEFPFFKKILDQAVKSRKLENKSKTSLHWFAELAIGMSGEDPLVVFATNFIGEQIKAKGITRDQILKEKNAEMPPALGQLYLIEYRAKHYPKKLPYYDRYPLILILKRTSTGFLGLNFHYLPPTYRAKLFQQLLKLESTDWKTKEKKLKVTYQLLSAYARYKLFRPCIKQYLLSHIGHSFIKIHSYEWELALFLPTEKFIGAPKKQVWEDSIAIIKKNNP